jgi:hypothetical protein
MHAPRVGHPCEGFLDWRQRFAIAQIPRGQQQARQARLDRVRRVSPPRIAGAFHQPARLMPCEVFSMRCSARRRLDNLRRGCFDTRAETRMPGPATIERAPCRLHRTRQIERLASRMARRVAAEPSINFPLRWALDCGTGLMHGRGQTDRRFAAGMPILTDSQSKTARAIGWKVVLCGRDGWQARLSASDAAREVGHAAHFEEATEVTGTAHQTRKTRQPHYDCDRGMMNAHYLLPGG